MIYNFVIIRTSKGGKFARKIKSSIRWINEHKYRGQQFRTFDFTISDLENHLVYENGHTYLEGLNVHDTIIHPRCAYPYEKGWIKTLRELENSGYRVVNSVDAIKLTSNKLECSLLLQDKVNHPKSWEWRKDDSNNLKELKLNNIADNVWTDENSFFIAKPLTSIEQGANVRKIDFNKFYDIGGEFIRAEELIKEIEKVPGEVIVLQEFIPYNALHRVIVIGGKALPFTFVDRVEWHRNGDWKVSCCLNKTTMRLNENASPDLIRLAEKTQKLVNGSINFIDIFEYEGRQNDGLIPRFGRRVEYSIGEINTACSLNIHERLAKAGHQKLWNIHYRIAKQLVAELVG